MYKSSIQTSSCLLDTSNANITASSQQACQQVINNLLGKIAAQDIELLIVHYSVAFDSDVLKTSLADAFPDTLRVGCSSAGEFNMDGYQTQSIVLIALHKSDFVCSAELLTNLGDMNFDYAYKTAADLRQRLFERAPFEIKQQMVISYLDGLTKHEENFLHAFSPVFGNTPHFGGSAGDDQRLEATYVMFNDEIVDSAAVMILVGTKRRFRVFSNDHIETPVSRLVVTDAEPSTRTVFELNGEPAAQYYAKLLGKKAEELTPEEFSTSPLAVLTGDKYFIRSIQKVDVENNSISFYCAVDLGMILTVVQLGDCAASLKRRLNQLREEYGEADFVYGCDCFLRRLDIAQNGKQDEIRAMQREFHIAGFNAYGEHMNSIHMNQTFTGVYFARINDQAN